MVPGAPQRPGRPGRLVGRRRRLAGRVAPARGVCARPQHAVRALDRARDGQPGLRSVPRAPGLDPGHRQRVPPLQRHQLVLDLTRPEVTGYLLERISRLLSEYEISYVKWDCNRDIIDAGSGARSGAPAAHHQALAVYALLDELRARHPGVEWESGAAGGGRFHLAILERVQRVWTWDMTDALARQSIQRWTAQLVPPEYLGAHVSASFSHQTGRYMPMSLRCATALFGHLGIEADITQARAEDIAELADWIRLYKRHRALIHSGRVVRIDTPDDTAWMHGVVAADQSAALMSYVQLDDV